MPKKVQEQVEEEYIMVKTSVGRMIFNEKLPLKLRYYHKEAGQWLLGKVMNKKELGALVAACFNAYGATQTSEVIDSVKRLGYHYACIAGMTVAISDCIVPPAKAEILAHTAKKVKKVERHYTRGIITEKERYNKVIELWNEATEKVSEAMMENMDEFNPIYMMSDSGARGNKQQMRQLAGMRGLMADPSGKIIDLPITANFREGLSVSDYFISSHGARKGLADTALRTADSGYLTRRLVDVAQDVIVRRADCDERKVNLLLIRAALAPDTGDAVALLNEKLLGRVLAEDIVFEGKIVLPKNSVLDDAALEKLIEIEAPFVFLRNGLETQKIKLGTRFAPERENLRLAFIQEYLGQRLPSGTILTKPLLEKILDSEDITDLVISNLNIRGIEVQAIREGKNGVIEPLKDRIVGRVLAENVFDAKGNLIAPINSSIDESLAEKICAARQKVKIRSVLTCKSPQGVCQKCYGMDLANHSEVEIGEAVGIIAAQSIGEPGTQLTMRTFHTGGIAGGDITQGLPRVEELFEARKPKMCAIIAEVTGTVSIGKSEKNNLTQITITPKNPTQAPREYIIPFGIPPRVKDGDFIHAGDNLTDGAKNPHDILRICGLKETQRYLVKEVQKVYKSQGVEINDKHIEVMVRQMLHKVTIMRMRYCCRRI